MNEAETNELIKKSLLQTSSGFTDELMRKIILEKKVSRKFSAIFIMACGCSIVLLFLMNRLPSSVSILNAQLKLPPLSIKVLVVLFVFIILNKLMVIKTALRDR